MIWIATACCRLLGMLNFTAHASLRTPKAFEAGGYSAMVFLMSGETQNSTAGYEPSCPQNQPEKPEVFISEASYGELISICLNALPDKAFGLVGGTDIYHPKSFYPC